MAHNRDHSHEGLRPYAGDPLRDPMHDHIRLTHGHNAKISVPENTRWHDELHRIESVVPPLLCRLGLHRWPRSWTSADIGRYTERACRRRPCDARKRRAWYGGRWIRRPEQRCTHGSDGGPIPCCVACANDLPSVWRR